MNAKLVLGAGHFRSYRNSWSQFMTKTSCAQWFHALWERASPFVQLRQELANPSSTTETCWLWLTDSSHENPQIQLHVCTQQVHFTSMSGKVVFCTEPVSNFKVFRCFFNSANSLFVPFERGVTSGIRRGYSVNHGSLQWRNKHSEL